MYVCCFFSLIFFLVTGGVSFHGLRKNINRVIMVTVWDFELLHKMS